MQPKILLQKIQAAFPAYEFTQSDTFAWRPAQQQIYYEALHNTAQVWTLLHELGHGVLGHTDYHADIQLLDQEMAAWEEARTVLAPKFGLSIDTQHIEEYLDTYRLWLHKRSLCPQCQHNGIQTTQNTYSCLNCRCLWRVNEARVCNLRRTRQQA